MCVSKSEVIDPGGDDGGGDSGDNGDNGDSGEGGGVPPIGDEDDPCDQFGDDGDDGDDNSEGDGHDNDEDFAPHMIECSECNLPNPPAGCPVDEDDEEDEEDEEEEPCETGSEVVDTLAETGLFQELFDLSNENEGLLRVETGAFANSPGGNYTVMNPAWFGSCGINIPDEFLTPETIGNIIPPGTNTFVHTHYWEAGEPMLECIDDVSMEMLLRYDQLGQLGNYLNLMNYNIPNYANQMSRNDLAFMDFLFEHTDITNFVVIDNETIMIVTPETDNPQQPDTEPRCGY